MVGEEQEQIEERRVRSSELQRTRKSRSRFAIMPSRPPSPVYRYGGCGVEKEI